MKWVGCNKLHPPPPPLQLRAWLSIALIIFQKTACKKRSTWYSPPQCPLDMTQTTRDRKDEGGIRRKANAVSPENLPLAPSTFGSRQKILWWIVVSLQYQFQLCT